MKRLGSALAPLLLIAALTACGGSDDETPDAAADATTSATQAPTVDTEEDTGDDGTDTDADDVEGEVAGDGYSYDLPDGWKEATARFKELNQMVDTGAIATGAPAADGFAENINVIIEDFPGSLDEYLDIALPLIEKQASDVKRLDDTEVGDEPAAHVTSGQSSGGQDIFTDQYVVSLDGRVFVITLSHEKSSTDAERAEIADEVLDSFEWDAA